MSDFTTYNTFKKIEHYLYNYDFIDVKISILKSEILDTEYNHNYTRWIKNKSSSLEDLVIKNIDIERRILKLRKWKKLIDNILEEYGQNNQLFYNFINLKYFRKVNTMIIQEKLNLNIKEQKDIQAKILQYIFLLAIKHNMLKEVNI